MQTKRLNHLQRFYDLIAALDAAVGGARTLAECTGNLNWPKRGVYLFTEDGEIRTHTGTGPRIVRVGTHALKTGSGTAFGRAFRSTAARRDRAAEIIGAQSLGCWWGQR
jgi:hypothetical protein